MNAAAARPGLSPATVSALILTLALAGLIAGMAWTGFLGSDDSLYADAAQGWLGTVPFLGTNHWALRHTMVLPMALSFRLFGIGESAMVLVPLAYYLGLVALSWWILATRLSPLTACLGSVLVASAPLLALGSSTAFVDPAEAFFVVASVTVFVAALDDPARRLRFVLAGILVGCAWLSRETAAALILAYGLMFVIGLGTRRFNYVLVGAGAGAVFALELLYYRLMSGNPFHRFTISASHDIIDRGAVGAGGFDVAGNLSANSLLLDPLLMMFANHYFGLIFFLFIPAVIWLFRRSGREWPALRVFVLVSLVWLVFIFANSAKLYLVPRYITVPTFFASVVIAVWLVKGVAARSVGLAWGLGLVLLGSNLACVLIDNKDFFRPERVLVETARTGAGPVYTDPLTASRAWFLLASDGLDGKVVTAPPPPGAVFVHVPANVAKGRVGGNVIGLGGRSFSVADYSPVPGSEILSREFGGRRRLVGVLRDIGVYDRLPGFVQGKLGGAEIVTVYRVGATGG